MTERPLTSPEEVLDTMLTMVRDGIRSGLNPTSININRAAMQALGPKELAVFHACYPGVGIKIVQKAPKL